MSCPNPFRIPAFLLITLCAAGVYGQGPYQSYQPQQIDRYVGEQVPDIWDESQPIERFLSAVAKRSRLSVEYLHWDLKGPQSGTLGAPITDVDDPSVAFEVFDNLNAGAITGLAIVPDINSMGMEDASGVRGTLDVALNGGSLELSFFGTGQNGSDVNFPNLQANRIADPTGNTDGLGTSFLPNIVTPLTTNGVANSSTTMNSFVYDNSFQASIDGQLWGSEVLLLKELYLPNEAFNWQWLGGFRYISYDEEMMQLGTFNDGGELATPRVTRIGGNSVNNVYGPQIGGRASIRTEYITLSATPRIAFALNDHTSSVMTGPLTALDEPVVRITEESIHFTPVVEINLQMQIHVTPHFSIVGGYDLFYIMQTSRPSHNIVYDSTAGGAAFTPDIGQKVSLKQFMAQGINIGGLWTY